MMTKDVMVIKQELIEIGRQLWDKDLATGLSGNLSRRVDAGSFCITASQTCLGKLAEDHIVHMDCGGGCDAEAAAPSSEWRLHAAIYKAFADCGAVAHVHAVHTNAFFLTHERLRPRILEAQYVLGEIPAVDQHTLNVEDCDKVVDALQDNSIVVLRNHGCLAIGQNLFECFVKLQTLEEAAKTEIFCKIFEE